jgi:hypothetical protein
MQTSSVRTKSAAAAASSGQQSSLVGFVRGLKGKRPANRVRDAVKMILRAYKDMNTTPIDLAVIQSSAAEALDLSLSGENASDPEHDIYHSILELFGDRIAANMTHFIPLEKPTTVEGCDHVKGELKAEKAQVLVFFGLYKLTKNTFMANSHSAVNSAEFNKIDTLVNEAKASIDAFYDGLVASLVNCKKNIRNAASAATTAAHAAERQAAKTQREAAAANAKSRRAASRAAPKETNAEATNRMLTKAMEGLNGGTRRRNRKNLRKTHRR